MNHSLNRINRLLSPIAIIVAVGAFLLLFGLDNRPFWQDEAETACLARNVLKYGVPRAYDGVNIISQEQGQEYDQNFLWRWSPWLQIYVTAAAFRLGGLTTYAGRLPFALLGLACIILVYQLVRHNFGDRPWALISAALLTSSVPFLLYARQCRYYSLGALLTLISLYAFMDDWQKRFLSALLLCFSIVLLFYTNYLLFFSFVVPALLAAFLLYPQYFNLRKFLLIMVLTLCFIFPGMLLYKIKQQSAIINPSVIPGNFENYVGGLFQYLIPLPIALYLLWRWRRILWTRSALPAEPGERFILFLSLTIVGNVFLLTLIPQCEHRYLVHLYPLCAIILGWVVCAAWRYYKVSGVLLGVLLLFTNWLYLVPMDWLHITNRSVLNDRQMLTYPNLPLKLFLTELGSGYPDVTYNLIRFFQTHAHPGEVILITYDDLPLQFYTPFKVLGGLQGNIKLDQPPDWMVLRWYTRWNRAYQLNESERLIQEILATTPGYAPVVLPFEDQVFGNNPDPYEHRFIPAENPLPPVVIYKKLASR